MTKKERQDEIENMIDCIAELHPEDFDGFMATSFGIVRSSCNDRQYKLIREEYMKILSRPSEVIQVNSDCFYEFSWRRKWLSDGSEMKTRELRNVAIEIETFGHIEKYLKSIWKIKDKIILAMEELLKWYIDPEENGLVECPLCSAANFCEWCPWNIEVQYEKKTRICIKFAEEFREKYHEGASVSVMRENPKDFPHWRAERIMQLRRWIRIFQAYGMIQENS